LFALPPIDPVIKAVAAARSCEGAVISHASACLAHELPLLGREPAKPEITVPPSSNPQVVNSHVHRASLPPTATQPFRNTWITSPARTAVDVGRSRGARAFVVAADAALHSGTATLAELESVAADCWNWPGIRRATRALTWLDPRSESALESLSRISFREQGLPHPKPQTRIGTTGGRFVGRVDFYWDEFGVVGEADGLTKYKDDDDTLQNEKLRQEHLEQLGLVVVRWVWNDATRRPAQLAGRIRSAFARGQHSDRSGSLRRWSVLPPEPVT
jgi:very-short-patch-repair endonuclease